MATKKKIETPGATINTELDTAQSNVTTITDKANGINLSIAKYQSIIDDPNSSTDAKEHAQANIDALISTKEIIESSLLEASKALENIKAKEQESAAAVRLADMTGININVTSANILENEGVELTPEGYSIKERT